MLKAICFTISSKLYESFCFYSINSLLNKYYKSSVGLTSNYAKAYSHLFDVLAYLFPLVGAGTSDSHLDKYCTIVYFSMICFIGNFFSAILSINNLLNLVVLFATAFVPLILVSTDFESIKPYASSYGDDQFLNQQCDLMEKFF